jgi:nucleotide-binding universal stress UspA family protein
MHLMTDQATQSGGPAGDGSARPILIGYDGSDGARRAVRRVAALFPGRQTLVVTAWLGVADAAPELTLAPGGLIVAAVESLSEVMQERATGIADDGVRLAGEAGLPAQSRTVRSHRAIWEGITRCADEAEAELIVLGSRGHGAITAAILGSVSTGVLHHAHRSVLIVSEHDAR